VLLIAPLASWRITWQATAHRSAGEWSGLLPGFASGFWSALALRWLGSYMVTTPTSSLALGFPHWAGSCLWSLPRKTPRFLSQHRSLRYPARLRPITSSEITQQLERMESDLAGAQRNLGQLPDITRALAGARRSLEQLAAKQEQIAQSIATLQRFEQDIKQKMVSAPQSRPVPLPPRKPPQQPAAQSSAEEASSVPAAVPATQQPLPLR
jgi:hypothetical protein